jgi:hypothetical protein
MFFYRTLGGIAWLCESMSRTSTNGIPFDLLVAGSCGVSMCVGWPEASAALALGDPGSLGNPLASLGLEMLALLGLMLILYMRLTRFVVFKKQAVLNAGSKGASSSTYNLEAWVTGYFSKSQKRRHFNVVPCRLQFEGFQSWNALATINTSRSFSGFTVRKEIGEWDLCVDLGNGVQIEEGTIFFGSKAHPALRFVGRRTDSAILGFADIEERESFYRLNALSRHVE